MYRTKFVRFTYQTQTLATLLWFLSMLWFASTIALLTNFFNAVVDPSSSVIFLYILVGLILTGVLSFTVMLVTTAILLVTNRRNRYKFNTNLFRKSFLLQLFLVGSLGILLLAVVSQAIEVTTRSTVSLQDTGKLDYASGFFNQNRAEPQGQGLQGIKHSITSEELFELTNRERTLQGLSKLSYSKALEEAAYKKLEDMERNNYWAHTSPDGITPWHFIKKANYNYEHSGENLARGYNSSSEVIREWMASPGHKENIISPKYKEVAFAVKEVTLGEERTVLVVQMFGSQMPPNSVQTAQGTNPYHLDKVMLSNYLSALKSSKASWESVSGQYPPEQMGFLLDSLERQIQFTTTILTNIENNTGASDNMNLWSQVVKMSYESNNIANNMSKR